MAYAAAAAAAAAAGFLTRLLAELLTAASLPGGVQAVQQHLQEYNIAVQGQNHALAGMSIMVPTGPVCSIQ